MSALRLHLRSSPARWGFVPLLVLGTAVLFGRSRFWIGIWPESGAAVQVSAVFISVLAAGIAAWIAAMTELRGLYHQADSATIRPFVITLYRFAAALLWLVAPYAALLAVGFVTTAVTLFAPGVGSYFQYVLPGFVMIILGTAWGWLVGRLLSPFLAAVCAALSWFIASAFLGGATNAVLISGPPWTEVRVGAVAVRLVAALLFAVAVCAVPWRADWRGPFGRRVAVAMAAVVGVATTFMVTSVVRHRAPVAEPLCVQGAMTYCLWPEHAKYIPMIRDLDRRVSGLPVRLALPDRIVDYALSGSTTWIDDDTEAELPGSFAPEFDISVGSRWALARGVSSAILGSVFAGCPVAAPDPGQRWEQLRSWLELRLTGGGTPDYSTNAPPEVQAAWSVGRRMAEQMSEQEQAAWVSRVVTEEKGFRCRAR